MKVQIRLRGIEGSRALIEHATRRIQRQLSRFGTEITAVVLSISDQNGPRGGRDKRYLLSVVGPRIGRIHLSELHDDVRAGLDLALGRLSHKLGRSLERLREVGPRSPARVSPT